jgi:hypothetical protein
MDVTSEELALRYLLELSTDIRVALLFAPEGDLLAAAPDPPSETVRRAAGEIVGEARALARAVGEEAVELDVIADGGNVLVVCEGGPALACVAGPLALPGLLLHDMRIALADLRRSEAPGMRS